MSAQFDIVEGNAEEGQHSGTDVNGGEAVEGHQVTQQVRTYADAQVEENEVGGGSHTDLADGSAVDGQGVASRGQGAVASAQRRPPARSIQSVLARARVIMERKVSTKAG